MIKSKDKKDNWGILNHGVFAVDAIKNEVNSYYAEWLSDTSRQEQYITHEKTFMYQLCELDYMWSMKETGYCNTKNSLKTQTAQDQLRTIYEFLEQNFEGKVVRCEIINMSANSRVRDHKDRSDVLYLSRRFHIPLKTNPMCFFTVNDQTVNMLEGNLYEINNTKWHNVRNASSENRIHLIIDIMPNEHTENIRFQ